MNIRNIAIIAHVDHGKTTLVDRFIEATNTVENRQMGKELMLDSGDLERERGITITSKNISIRYGDCKINILDTPGHSDFGGEVERVLKMADGVLLLVDAFEGPMPQTRFVTQKALELNLQPIIVINKVDKPNCNPDETLEKVYDLMLSLDANEEQLDAPVVYGSGKQGWMSSNPNEPTDNVHYLLDVVLEKIPAPKIHEGPFQLQITSLDFSNYTGRIAIGRIHRGEVKENMNTCLVKANQDIIKARVKEIYVFEGLGKTRVDHAASGEVVALVGLDGFDIGDTVTDVNTPEPLPIIKVEEPTISMLFTINDSPFFGKEGKFVTSRQLRDRLFKETEKNLALKVEETDSADQFLVYGRGILHLAILIETMRREGYELQVGQPQVIVKMIDGVKNEPFEQLVVDVPSDFSGKVIELVSTNKGDLLVMEPKGEYTHLEFEIPSRGLIGLRSQMLTATRGEAVMSHRFINFQPMKPGIAGRTKGVIISKDKGPAIAYSLFNLQQRGSFFVGPGDEVYGGQIIGETPNLMDLVVNVQKSKQLTNIRAAGSDEAVVLEPPIKMSLEECLEYIAGDEYVEVTPSNIRLRKIYLNEHDRKRYSKQSEPMLAK